MSSGYLKKIEKTKKEFDKYGYFHTGDIAIFTTDGCIKIVDRLKNLVKLKGGEYIALESMEKEYVVSVRAHLNHDIDFNTHFVVKSTQTLEHQHSNANTRTPTQVREKYLRRR